MIRNAVSQAMPGLRRPGRALRRVAGVAPAAVELVLGRAIFARANQIALFAFSDRVPAVLERLLLCPGCIDGRPTDMANIIALLQRGNLLRGVGGVPRRFPIRVCRVSRSATRNRPFSGTFRSRASAAIASLSSSRANTPSITAEWPCASTRPAS